MRFYRAALVVAMTFPIGCVQLPTQPTPPPAPVVIVTQNQNSHNVGATDPTGTSATPTPTPAAGSLVATWIRVGIFTQTCPDGGPVPDNGLETIRKECAATLTATPKNANNEELKLPESAFQAMSVSWSISGGACQDLGEGNGNKFNRVVKGAAVGTCSVCATVNGLTGCARQPTGEQLVRVVQ